MQMLEKNRRNLAAEAAEYLFGRHASAAAPVSTHSREPERLVSISFVEFRMKPTRRRCWCSVRKFFARSSPPLIKSTLTRNRLIPMKTQSDPVFDRPIEATENQLN